MIILALRTDAPEAKMAIFDGDKRLGHAKWLAHRQLAATIHKKLKKILDKSSIDLKNIEGIVCYKGPGSFTGLRIGLTMANTLAYSYQIPIVARSGGDWRERGIKDILTGKDDKIAIPEYGSPPKTTKPRGGS